MRLLTTLFLLAVLSVSAQAQSDLKRLKVTKEISLGLPENFRQMTETEVGQKYVSAKPPLAVYTSPDSQVDLGVNTTSSPWAGNDLEILKSFYKANLLQLFTEVNFIQEEIKTIGKQQFVVFEFTSKYTDQNSIGETSTTSKYTYIQYTISNHQVLVFNFTCPAKLRSTWQQTAAAIMESIRIKS